MGNLTNFNEVDDLYSAIRNIDRKIAADREDLLDEVWASISGIKKEQFDHENVKVIVNSVRDALLKIYLAKVNEINEAIGIQSNVAKENQLIAGNEYLKIGSAEIRNL